MTSSPLITVSPIRRVRISARGSSVFHALTRGLARAEQLRVAAEGAGGRFLPGGYDCSRCEQSRPISLQEHLKFHQCAARRARTHGVTLASASSSACGLLPPAWAKSARPPPLPPTWAATALMSSPALTRPV